MSPTLQVKMMEHRAALDALLVARGAAATRALEFFLKVHDDMYAVVETALDNDSLVEVLECLEEADAKLDAEMARLGLPTVH